MDKKRIVPSKSAYRRITASHTFVTALALVSIVGFIGIVSETLFDFDMRMYIEAMWMFIIGIGLVLEGQIPTLKRIRTEGLTPQNFTHLTTVVIGAIAIVAGILSLPFLRVESAGFMAVKGIISLIAIVIIVIQTWIVE